MTIIPGTPESPTAKVCVLSYVQVLVEKIILIFNVKFSNQKQLNHDQLRYQFEMYEILTDQLCSTPTRIEIEFLTQLNENKNCSTIAEMACWGNQLYIVDSGRHKVYLTDLVGNIRKSVGKEKSINAGEFTKPSAICVDSVGNFIVADSQRLQD